MGDYRYRVTVYGIAVDKKNTANYTAIDQTYTIDSQSALDEEDIVNEVLSIFSKNGQKLIRTYDQAAAGIDRISSNLVFGIEEDKSDQQFLLNRGFKKRDLLERDKRGRFVSNKEKMRRLRRETYTPLSEAIPKYTTEQHKKNKGNKKRR